MEREYERNVCVCGRRDSDTVRGRGRGRDGQRNAACWSKLKRLTGWGGRRQGVSRNMQSVCVACGVSGPPGCQSD